MAIPTYPAPYNPAAVAITGGTVVGLSKAAVRDTSAAYDVVVAATSSVPLTAERTLTIDVQNSSQTVKAANVPTDNQATAVANLANGNVSATQKNLVSSAELAVVDSLASGGWADLQARRIAALAQTATGLAAITGFRAFKLGEYVQGVSTAGTGVADALLDGGGLSFTAASWVSLTSVIVNAPKTSTWAFGFRGILPSPIAGQNSLFGLSNGTNRVCIANDQRYNYAVLHSWAGAPSDLQSTFWLDSNVRDFALLFDSAHGHAYLQVDGITALDSTALDQFPTTASGIKVYMGGGVGLFKVQQVFYAWVAP